MAEKEITPETPKTQASVLMLPAIMQHLLCLSVSDLPTSSFKLVKHLQLPHCHNLKALP